MCDLQTDSQPTRILAPHCCLTASAFGQFQGFNERFVVLPGSRGNGKLVAGLCGQPEIADQTIENLRFCELPHALALNCPVNRDKVLLRSFAIISNITQTSARDSTVKLLELFLAPPREKDGKWLTRKAAADYLTSIGCPISARTLELKGANQNAGKGPPFHRTGWKTLRYNKSDLDAWAFKVTKRVE